uniref:Uncharacterized protein n=1 Tax=Physcomitrium patens TaxID=3218 RepID=A0A2K1I9Z5_PHYPA|nr:hypothetical protein PHYPA_031130 [Physcomitrium patens]
MDFQRSQLKLNEKKWAAYSAAAAAKLCPPPPSAIVALLSLLFRLLPSESPRRVSELLP